MDVGARQAHLVLQPSNKPRQPADLSIQAVLLGVRGAWERGTVMLTGTGPGRSPPPPDRGLASSPPFLVPAGGPGPIGTPPRQCPHPGPRLSPGRKFFPCSAAMSLWFGAQGGVGLPDQVSTVPWLGRLWFCLQRGWGNAPREGGCRALTARSSSDRHSAPTVGLKRAQNSQEPHPLELDTVAAVSRGGFPRRGWHLGGSVPGPARVSQAPTSLRLSAAPHPPCLPRSRVQRPLGSGPGFANKPPSKKRSRRTQSSTGV